MKRLSLHRHLHIVGGVAEEFSVFRLLEQHGIGLSHAACQVGPVHLLRYGGGPVGLDTLAANLGEESVTLEDVCEPYLMQMGMLTRTPRGRCVTRLAYEHLNMPVPKHLRAEDDDDVDGQQRMY